MDREPDRPGPPPEHPAVRPQLRGARAIMVLAVVCGLMTVVSLLDMLTLKPLSRGGDPLFYSLTAFRSAGLGVVGWLLWGYSAAVREYGARGEVAVERLEAAHAGLWKWTAWVVAAYFIHAAVVIAARVPV